MAPGVFPFHHDRMPALSQATVSPFYRQAGPIALAIGIQAENL
jgi:hypothetical protein